MFFENDELERRKAAILRAPPLPPGSNWTPPREFPNLSAATVLAVDCETKDTELLEAGPGWTRGPRGHIIGVSLAARDRLGNRGKWYFPCRHEVEPELNLDPHKLFSWLKPILENNVTKVGANLIYDYGWLTEENIFLGGQLLDCQFAEALLDETARVNLDALAKKYIGGGKTTLALYQWLADAYGGKPDGKQRANMYRSPVRLAGPYAEDDADLPIDILEAQWPLLARDGLVDLFHLECRAIRLIVEMRRAGITVDLNRAEQLNDKLKTTIIPQLYAKLTNDFGVPITSTQSPKQMQALCDANGIEYPRTEQGNPSFQKNWLASLDHPVGKAINEIRGAEKMQGTFIESYILEKNIKGKIYCSYHPLLGEDGGTKTGRWSSSHPNLQNIPVRTEIGKLIRSIFIADWGHKFIRKKDYSQIEYRMLAHFATGKGSDDLRQKYINDPSTDYHDTVQENIKRLTGILVERRPIKNINFGLIYGQTQKSLAYTAGFTLQQSTDVFKAYHIGAPYVKPTMEAVAHEVQQFGYVRTILGRRTHFNEWEPNYWPKGSARYALPYTQALANWGTGIKRAYDYRGVNYKLQGSAADVLKVALVMAFESGVFSEIGVPRLQVHDELDWSVYNENVEAWRYVDSVLENSLPCRVPIKIETKDGLRWGEID